MTHSTSIPAVSPPPRPTYSISYSVPPLPRDPTIPSNISQTLSLALSPNSNSTTTCATVLDPSPLPSTASSGANASSCPSYFRFIHEDLHPWRVAGGITRAMVNHARTMANFRLVVIRGRTYIERIAPAFQTRDLQLLRRYPGRVPDLNLMFDCIDWPAVRADQYDGENATLLPPLFWYCGDNETLDVIFPDWSFWGWPKINIKLWDALQKELNSGNKKVKWSDREHYDYWKGNPDVRLKGKNWLSVMFPVRKNGMLRFTNRYKIYIEGLAWSVSEKYIPACDSMTLVVTPKYYDFYSRVLIPLQHYWPVQDEEKCSFIKYAIHWGISHKQKAQRIGNQASNFIQQELHMDYVYDYMFHLLTEYAKLLRFKVCPEFLACQAIGREKKFMEESMVRSANDAGPCDLPPPFSLEGFKALQHRREKLLQQIEAQEHKASKPVDSKP